MRNITSIKLKVRSTSSRVNSRREESVWIDAGKSLENPLYEIAPLLSVTLVRVFPPAPLHFPSNPHHKAREAAENTEIYAAKWRMIAVEFQLLSVCAPFGAIFIMTNSSIQLKLLDI